MNDPASRPAIAGKVSGMDAYSVVFVGFPIWWYTAPSIIKTFLESYDFAGKTVIPFATSGGSGLGKTANDLRAVCPAADIKDGKLLNGRPSAAALASWVKELGVRRLSWKSGRRDWDVVSPGRKIGMEKNEIAESVCRCTVGGAGAYAFLYS